ncbi:orotate phosphoribosyltransferase [Ornithinibacillus halotolerans]|uniref:Orotate phosphoribosyltransferase n=1 Tax=Ornithinibacillus halotolerans TaxID=1274357 RepID=A0A916S785_9BACI|nr:orotate phosphoribosyltransferase [Ornithinibacillus halotolerans]GGA84113.1 orotate phosphoribosyltransferase [Ornithinibacillus halotolerans]
MTLSKELARDLLQIKAVQINLENYFTWASGMKSPIYCDNRLTISYPEIRKMITNGFIEKVNQMNIKPDVIAGCATAGIPHAAWLADKLNLPMVYVRSNPKGHGKGNQIEGESVVGKNVLVIEDLISTGGSALKVVESLRESGASVLGVMSIFTYGLRKAKTNFDAAAVQYESLTNYEALIQSLVEDSNLHKDKKRILLEWRNSIES